MFDKGEFHWNEGLNRSFGNLVKAGDLNLEMDQALCKWNSFQDSLSLEFHQRNSSFEISSSNIHKEIPLWNSTWNFAVKSRILDLKTE